MGEEMLSEFEEDDSNHEIEKRDADAGLKFFKSHKFGGHKFGGHKTKSKSKKHHAPVRPVHHKVHGQKFLKHHPKKHHGKRDAEEEDEAVTKEDLAKIKQDIVDVLNELTVESLEAEAS